MILIGQYDSPFVRRVGIALTLYGLPFEHKPWSTFGDADKIRPYNPLTRVPTLVLDDGEVLIDSHSILDYLDSLVPADKRMFPVAEPARHRALKVAALATGHGREGRQPVLREGAAQGDVGRLDQPLPHADLRRARRARDRPRGAARPTTGSATASATPTSRSRRRCASSPTRMPGLVAMADFPALAAHAARLEALPVFQTISQPFIPPAYPTLSRQLSRLARSAQSC